MFRIFKEYNTFYIDQNEENIVKQRGECELDHVVERDDKEILESQDKCNNVSKSEKTKQSKATKSTPDETGDGAKKKQKKSQKNKSKPVRRVTKSRKVKV